ncbi:unnamed protein product, partial [Brassica oleracea]
VELKYFNLFEAAKEGGCMVERHYTRILLRYCLDNETDLKTYPENVQDAFDTIRRI